MGRSLRRREAWLLQSRAALLCTGLVGRRYDAVGFRQPRQMEFATETLSGRARAGWSLRQHVDDGQVRSAKSSSAQTPYCGRRQAARVLTCNHGSKLQGSNGATRRNLKGKCEFQKGERLSDGLHPERLSMVPGGGTELRQLHGPSLALLI